MSLAASYCTGLVSRFSLLFAQAIKMPVIMLILFPNMNAQRSVLLNCRVCSQLFGGEN